MVSTENYPDMPKKILIIGMLNSVHFANWLERISRLDAEIFLFPSRQYRDLHPKLKKILGQESSIKVIKLLPIQRFSVLLEFALETRWLNFINFYSRKARLSRLLRKKNFDKIHAIEIQHAGYLLKDALPNDIEFNNIIVTNWGSDIFYFSQFPEQVRKIQECLKMANFYSAECNRDYVLAKEYGFKGTELPVVPNSTTFTWDFFEEQPPPSRDRNQIMMKCYGGIFGLGELLLQAADYTLLNNDQFSIYAYSVTPELLSAAEEIRGKYPTRFKFSTVASPIAHQMILDEFTKSRLYVGASRSDGISTSFLEALATGAFPIQTSTSCASEWIQAGAKGLIVEPSCMAIQFAIDKVLNDVKTLEDAQQENFLIAKSRLSFETISEVTKSFYL